jgi:hypothetical protein
MKPELANVLKMSNIEHFSSSGSLHYIAVKTKELTLKQILSVPCPTCSAAAEEACELHTGTLRTEPHRVTAGGPQALLGSVSIGPHDLGCDTWWSEISVTCIVPPPGPTRFG